MLLHDFVRFEEAGFGFMGLVGLFRGQAVSMRAIRARFDTPQSCQ